MFDVLINVPAEISNMEELRVEVDVAEKVESMQRIERCESTWQRRFESM